MQPYFHWEDVVDTPGVQRSQPCLAAVVAQKSSSSRKALAESSTAKCCSPFLEAFDAESLSFSKATSFRSSKKHQAMNVEARGQANGTLHGVSPSMLLALEGPDPGMLPEEEQEEKRAGGPTGTSEAQRGIANSAHAVRQGFQPATAACGLSDGHSVDSGYGCFASEESLKLSYMFYPPDPETGSLVLPVAKVPPLEKDTLMRAGGLLTQSPPALNGLFILEGERRGEVQLRNSKPRCVSGVPSGGTPSQAKPAPLSLALPDAPECLGSPKRCSLTGRPLEAGSVPVGSASKADGLNWDDIFDLDDEELLGLQGPRSSLSPRDGCGGCTGRSRDPVDEGASGCLCDEARKPRRLPVLSGSSSGTGPALSDEHISGVSQKGPLSSAFIPRKEADDCSRACNAQPENRTASYDVSQDLFSVNFDLGFSIQDLEDDTSEQASPLRQSGNPSAVHPRNAEASPAGGSSLARTSPSTWSGDCLTRITFSTPLHLPPRKPGWRRTGNVVPEASPLSPAVEERGWSPDPVGPANSTPTGRRAMCARVPRGAFMRSLSGNRQASSALPLPSKANTSTVAKDWTDSAFGIEDLALRATGSGGNKEPCGSRALPAEGKSSKRGYVSEIT